MGRSVRAVDAVEGQGPTGPRHAQARVVAAALELFARQGVGGTSLQMIADELGVTKAAVYHQYRTKDAIVLAAAEAELGRLDAVVESAGAERSTGRARRALVEGVVDLAVDRRRTMSVLMADPYVLRLFRDDERFRDVIDRFTRLLVGDVPDGRLSTVLFMAAISGAVMHPLVADLDDETLRRQLLVLAGRLAGLPDGASGTPRRARSARG